MRLAELQRKARRREATERPFYSSSAASIDLRRLAAFRSFLFRFGQFIGFRRQAVHLAIIDDQTQKQFAETIETDLSHSADFQHLLFAHRQVMTAR